MKRKTFSIFSVEVITTSSTRQLHFLIEKSKGKYYPRITSKLSDIRKSSKTYWSILKSFFISKKKQCIPPLFENNEYIKDFNKKAELLNSFFAN